MQPQRAVFLDRDGVITIPQFRDGRSYAPCELRDFQIYSDVATALDGLKNLGFLLIVVTNQPDVGAGRLTLSTLVEMHRRLVENLPLDAIKVCMHQKDDGCTCRKPMPGMLIEAANEFGISLSASYMVGDRASDIEAGRSAGCRSIFVDLGYTSEKLPAAPDVTVRSLREAVSWILSNERG